MASDEAKGGAAMVAAALLLRKVGLGFLGAVYVWTVVTMVMVLSGILGVVLVHSWVEEPVVVRERLHFDYTHVYPKAVFSFFGGGYHEFEGYSKRKKMGVPVGHTIYVSLLLLMPDSDFNRDIGLFQLSAELISTHGGVMAKSSQPCMLSFHSLPIRFMRTFLMGIPLLLGLTSETQRVGINLLMHKEGNPRSEAIIIALIPRAGTTSVPQLYEAQLVVNSELPWTKRVVHSWKWTCCVWTSFYIFITLLMVLLCCCKPLVFFPMPSAASLGNGGERELTVEALMEQPKKSLAPAPAPAPAGRERELGKDYFSETLRKWQQRRSKRRAILVMRDGSPASSSISIAREDTSTTTACSS